MPKHSTTTQSFTEGAREVLLRAVGVARTFRHGYTGTEHILLGVLEEERGLAAEVLGSFRITPFRTREWVSERIGWGDAVSDEPFPFSGRASMALSRAGRERRMLGHEHTGTEHILLGLLLDAESVAARILLDFSLDPVTIRNELLRLMRDPSNRVRSRAYTSDGRPAVDPAYVEYLDSVLDLLEPEIRRELGREPDSGDLLLLLVAAQGTIAARALGELTHQRRRFRAARSSEGDRDALRNAIESARKMGVSSRRQIQRQVEEKGRAKHKAIEAKDFSQAKRLRSEERELLVDQGHVIVQLVEMLRRELGLPAQPYPREPTMVRVRPRPS